MQRGLKNIEFTTVEEDRESAQGYSNKRRQVVFFGRFVAIGFGVLLGIAYSVRLLSFEGGILGAKLFLGVAQGVLGGFAMRGIFSMVSLTVAPRAWVLATSEGRQWLERVGIGSLTSVGWLLFFRSSWA